MMKKWGIALIIIGIGWTVLLSAMVIFGTSSGGKIPQDPASLALLALAFSLPGLIVAGIGGALVKLRPKELQGAGRPAAIGSNPSRRQRELTQNQVLQSKKRIKPHLR